MSDVEGVVGAEDIEGESRDKKKKFVVKKGRIINNISKKINQVTQSPARKE